METKTKIAVIGAGNGGQTSAGHFGMMRFDVSIFDVSKKTIAELQQTKGVQLHGAIEGFGKINCADTDIGKVVDGAKIIFITLPSIYHKDVVKKMAPYIQNGTTIILHPGSTLSIVEVDRVLKENTSAKYVLGATCTLIYACRIIKNGEVQVFGLKDTVSAAALPASDNDRLEQVFENVYPGRMEKAPNSIYVSMENLNCIVHPAPTIFNVGRIESGENFQYYLDGFTPSVAKCVEKIDKERIEIAKAYGLNMPTCAEAYEKEYHVDGSSLYNAIHGVKAYEGIMCEKTLESRYLMEDVPYCLVPLKALADKANVKVPIISAVISLSYAVMDGKLDKGRDYDALHLDRFATLEDFIKYIELGE